MTGRGKILKILVVEDEPLIRLGVVFLFEDAGYTVSEATNADEAIRRLETDPEIRLVVTDVDMPGSMDGIKLAHFVRNRWPPVRLIVVSGKVGVMPEQLPEGVPFFPKPYAESQLLSAVGTLFEGGGARRG